MMGKAVLAAAAAALVALGGCTDKLVGFEASFASNTVAARAEPANGDRLRFRVPKRFTDAEKRAVYLVPQRAILHVSGYLPVAADAVSDAGESYEVEMTLPPDLVKRATGAAPNSVRATGELYIPSELGIVSFTRAELRQPTAARTVGVTLAAVHTGPMTRLAERVGEFFRGLYAAR